MKWRIPLVLSMVGALSCGGGGGSPGGGTTPLSDADLYARAVQDYNAKAYSTARAEFQQLLARPSANAYYDKATVYVAAADYSLGEPATCLAVLGSPTPPLSGFFQGFPGSADTDRARYWHGRCELGIAPPNYATARDDFTAVINMATSSYADNAYFWRGRSYYATATASVLLDSDPDWASALADFTKVVQSFSSGTVAPEAQYWIGRTHFSKGQAAKSRGTQAGDAVAQPELNQALVDLNAQLANYPASTWAPDVGVYIGRTHFEQASYAAPGAPQVSAYTVAVNDLLPLLGTTATIRDEANYWYGRALYGRGSAYGDGVDYANAKAQLEAAQAQLQAFKTDPGLSISKLADNASYWVGRCLYSLADLLRVQAELATPTATFSSAQAAFHTAELDLAATRSSSQFATSNVLDSVQVYLGRSQFEQGYCAALAGTPDPTHYASAQATLGSGPSGYFTLFGTTHESAASAHYWLGRVYYSQANPAAAVPELNAVVIGWDYVGIASSSKPTTVWWDNSYDYLIRAYSDQMSCVNAQTAYSNLKAALPSDPLLAPACTYMKDPARCPSNTCP